MRIFRGVPYAQPPVGDLRWREPRPVKGWKDVRDATSFGPRPMQRPIYSDMTFRSPSVDEDCLTLNVWAPARGEKLPVLVYFYGGGFQAGAADEKRYDGASMAGRGIVSITVNYRLGAFGFLAHPALSRESGHGSGNYGLMDQAAALAWVRKNAKAFGGDPKRVTIAGESAGSFSVCAQMASPLAKGLFAGAIGESGAIVGARRPATLAEGEANGLRFAAGMSLKELRAIPADRLLDLAKGASFGPVVDGRFLTKDPTLTFEAGEQAKVPLLAGWNAAESGPGGVLGDAPATRDGFVGVLRKLYGDRVVEALRAYPVASDEGAIQAATDLASDRFIGYGTWKWTELQARTGGKPVYRYFYVQPRPGEAAVHSAEIEYALGNLALNPRYAWTADDRATSKAMQGYFENFVKTGDPNGAGLPSWPKLQTGSTMRLGPLPQAVPEWRNARYGFLDSAAAGGR